MWHSEQHRLAPTRFATHQKPVAAGSIVPTLRKPRRVGQPVIYFLPEEKIKMGQPPIASFVNGKFENGGDQNSGIFLYPGSTPGSFTLLDQFPNLPHPQVDSGGGHPADVDNSRFTLVTSFTSKRSEWLKSECINIFDGKVYQLALEQTAQLDKVVPRTYANDQTDVAAGYKKRFERNVSKLFTFLDHDGV